MDNQNPAEPTTPNVPEAPELSTPVVTSVPSSPASSIPATPAPVSPATTPPVNADGDTEVLIGKYKVKVIRNDCIGAASCVAVSGATFQLDGENKAIILSDSQDSAENILMAAQSCPTKAIIVFDTETNTQVWPL